MKLRHIFTLILVLFVYFNSDAQNLTLQRWYPLNNGSGVDRAKHYDGQMQGTFILTKDRFGNENGAVQFNEGSYMYTPSMVDGFNYKAGFTITFWTKIIANHPKIEGLKPWYETDAIYRAFFAKYVESPTGVKIPMLGFYRRNDRVIIDRYVYDKDNEMQNWGIWLWDPINFTERQGWYFVVLSYEPSRMFVTMFYPNGQVERIAHYFAMQDLGLANSWGIGNSYGKSMVMDAFRVYSGIASETQARALYSRESLPGDGDMYEVALCADTTKFLHTVARGTQEGVRTEIYGKVPNNDYHTYKWIFLKPDTDKENRYFIRLSYEPSYLHVVNNRDSYVELSHIDLDPSYYWNIESTGDGYFYIRSEQSGLYLHVKYNSTSDGTRLEVSHLISSYAPMFKWKLNLIKTGYELQNQSIKPDDIYQVVLSDNPFLSQTAHHQLVTTGAPVKSDRTPYPSLLSAWKATGLWDGAFIFKDVTFSNDLHPEGRAVEAGTNLQTLKFTSAYRSMYHFIPEKTSKYGRRYRLRHCHNAALCVTAENTKVGTQLKLQRPSDSNSSVWAFYKVKNMKPNANIQIYDLKPGSYRIVCKADKTKALTTQNYSKEPSARVLAKAYAQQPARSFYWQVEYETDSAIPVRDGTYMIRLVDTENLMKTYYNSLESGTKIEVYPEADNVRPAQKWFVKPTRDGTKTFFIQCAGDPTKYMFRNTSDSSVELKDYNAAQENNYKWFFERVSD